jgi:hypothetical protein
MKATHLRLLTDQPTLSQEWGITVSFRSTRRFWTTQRKVEEDS